MSTDLVLEELHASFTRLTGALEATERTQALAVVTAANLLAETAIAGRTILACGNGGSAADSQHFVAELVSSFQRGLTRRSLAAIALTSNTSTLTAYANDFDFADVFAREVEGLGRPGDCLLAISTSGRSTNVLRASDAALSKGMTVIALVGPAQTPLSDSATVAIHAQGSDTQTIQAVHLAVEHLLCFAVEENVHENDARGAQ